MLLERFIFKPDRVGLTQSYAREPRCKTSQVLGYQDINFDQRHSRRTTCIIFAVQFFFSSDSHFTFICSVLLVRNRTYNNSSPYHFQKIKQLLLVYNSSQNRSHCRCSEKNKEKKIRSRSNLFRTGWRRLSIVTKGPRDAVCSLIGLTQHTPFTKIINSPWRRPFAHSARNALGWREWSMCHKSAGSAGPSRALRAQLVPVRIHTRSNNRSIYFSFYSDGECNNLAKISCCTFTGRRNAIKHAKHELHVYNGDYILCAPG